MAIYKVVRYPESVLLEKTLEVGKIGEREKILIRDMIDTMHLEDGVGLAANQVGVARRIFIASPDRERGKEMVFINPEIIKRSGTVTEQEGCLSIPGFYEKVKRWSRVTLRAETPDGQTVEVEADGLLARIFQHETDHLNGVVFIDRLGFLGKRKALKYLNGTGPSVTF